MNNTTMVRLHTGNPEVGTLRLWVPEAIASNTGFSAVYPVGTWEAQDCACAQTVSREGLIGPGSFRRVDEKTLESLGRRAMIIYIDIYGNEYREIKTPGDFLPANDSLSG